MNQTPLVEMRDIHRYFGRVKALIGVNFYVNAGEIVGLLGDNGAGKSTLIKVLTGIHQPTKGDIFIEGQPVQIPRRMLRVTLASKPSIKTLRWCL